MHLSWLLTGPAALLALTEGMRLCNPHLRNEELEALVAGVTYTGVPQQVSGLGSGPRVVAAHPGAWLAGSVTLVPPEEWSEQGRPSGEQRSCTQTDAGVSFSSATRYGGSSLTDHLLIYKMG